MIHFNEKKKKKVMLHFRMTFYFEMFSNLLKPKIKSQIKNFCSVNKPFSNY